MLVLSRKKGESIMIGDDIAIIILEITPTVVRIGIQAPPDVRILRSELYDPVIDPKE